MRCYWCVDALDASNADDNTAVGYGAMTSNTTGIRNAALGQSALGETQLEQEIQRIGASGSRCIKHRII